VVDVEKIYLQITRGRIGFSAKFTGLGQGSGCHETTTVILVVFISHMRNQSTFTDDVV